jgi:hypothetical protein
MRKRWIENSVAQSSGSIDASYQSSGWPEATRNSSAQ